MNTPRYLRLTLYISLCLASACTPIFPSVSCGKSSSGERMMQSELYFGQTRPKHGTIGESQWEKFLHDYVSSRFPNGFTVFDAHGQWRSVKRGIQRERTKVVVIVHDASQKNDDSIEYLRAMYKSLYNQESVLRVDVCADASF